MLCPISIDLACFAIMHIHRQSSITHITLPKSKSSSRVLNPLFILHNFNSCKSMISQFIPPTSLKLHKSTFLSNNICTYPHIVLNYTPTPHTYNTIILMMFMLATMIPLLALSITAFSFSFGCCRRKHKANREKTIRRGITRRPTPISSNTEAESLDKEPPITKIEEQQRSRATILEVEVEHEHPTQVTSQTDFDDDKPAPTTGQQQKQEVIHNSQQQQKNGSKKSGSTSRGAEKLTRKANNNEGALTTSLSKSKRELPTTTTNKSSVRSNRTAFEQRPSTTTVAVVLPQKSAAIKIDIKVGNEQQKQGKQQQKEQQSVVKLQHTNSPEATKRTASAGPNPPGKSSSIRTAKFKEKEQPSVVEQSKSQPHHDDVPVQHSQKDKTDRQHLEGTASTSKSKDQDQNSQRKKSSGDDTNHNDDEDEPNWGDHGEDFDAICEGNLQENDTKINRQSGNLLLNLLSQSMGMDLSKVMLPTFVLERRSLLEMYAEFFAHPDDFISPTEQKDPEQRFLAVVKFYLSFFYQARKCGVAKKPYNPILGETFRCRWTLPGTRPSKHKTRKGPFPGSSTNQVTFVAEQVSHHPPVSAIYAEHSRAGVTFTAHIYTKPTYFGLSVGVHNIGSGTITLHKYDEDYVFTFPSAYGRSIMSTPWIELGGKVEIRCDKTKYIADIEFHTKPLFRGKAHQIQGKIYHGETLKKKPLIYLKGFWNSKINISREKRGEYRPFVDVQAKPDVHKECLPVMQQEKLESRRLWRHVTVALFRGNIEVATKARNWIEQRQRDERAKREKEGREWKQRLFEQDGNGWRFKEAWELRRKHK